MEDEASYSSVLDEQSSGWHWGLNNANACNGDRSNCGNGDDIEHISVIGDPIDPIDNGFSDFGGPGFGGGDGGDHGDGGGSGGGSNGSDTGPQPSEREQCHSRAESEYDTCEEIALGNHLHESGYCQEMAPDPFATYEDIEECEDRLTYNYNYDQQQCFSRFNDDINFCNTHFSN